MTSRKTLTRRRFAQAAAAAGFTFVPRHVLGGAKHVPPSETVHLAIVGCGGQGRVNTKNLLGFKDVKIVAVADPREQADYSRFYYKGVAGRGPVKKMVEDRYKGSYKCAEYVDFRTMLEKEKDIDAVLCATPDHWHAWVSMTAIRHGKHVYCEKPLTHNIYEARTLAAAAEKAGVATQMGNQGRSSRSHAVTCEMIWNGAIGTPKAAYAWSGAGRWAEGRGRPKETQPIPKDLDWDLWLGPEPDRPYHIAYCPYNWRGWWAFGCGAVGDMMVHNIEPAFAAFELDKRHPVSVECIKTDFVDDEVIAGNNQVVWKYDKQGDKPALEIHWHDGKLRADVQGVEGRKDWGGNGVLILGDKGAMQGGGWSKGVRIIPEAKNRAYLMANKGKTPARTQPSAPSHHHDWLAAARGGRPALSNFSYGAKLTEFVLLGNVAIRAGGKIQWDGPNMRVTNNDAAQQFIKETYRKGWDLTKV